MFISFLCALNVGHRMSKGAEIPAVYGWDDKVALRVAPPQISVGALIEQVQMCLETPAIAYWVASVSGVKRKRFAESSLPDFQWAYEFKLEDEDGKVYTVNVDTIRNGLKRVTEPSFQVNPSYREVILRELYGGLQEGGFGSGCLDIVVQAGLFGEIIYG